ncbi:GNAT family N-acetyltransferase [Candidatus Contendibacter odensensis]|uniref:BioF2-like acetyltransferase domain-containing protein n=1 Tax=Candidatus Contendobacter odensis Run_B_J11 TaxID=1400861 RepID=A0A7U7G7S0_9GAMM|nr:GNAT family N-acetyltransferase [Candidatus Contendobacter odensis]CDH43051.1 conserved hypothetical protein [Candidatus Contendobacter odensis Run_B_J11]
MSCAVANPPVEVRVIESFDDLPDEIAQVLVDCKFTDLHHTLDWFRLLAATALEPGGLLRIYWVAPSGQPLLCVPCLFTSASPPQRLAALSNFYTPLFGPVGNHGVTPDNVHRWVQHVTSERPRWDIIDLQPLDPTTAFFRLLLEEFRRAGWWVDSYFCFGNWYLEVAARTFADYWVGLSSRMRNTISRAQRRLERMPGFQLAIVTAPGPDLDAAINAYQTVYACSWKQPEPFPHFIPALCRLAAERGWLRLGVIHLDQQPVAAQLWLCDGQTASIVKLAHDQSLVKLGAGSVLTAALMQYVMDIDRIRIVDYLIGDDAYKREWMSHRRERCGFIAFNPRTIRGVAGAIHHFGGKIWRGLAPLHRPDAPVAHPSTRPSDPPVA